MTLSIQKTNIKNNVVRIDRAKALNRRTNQTLLDGLTITCHTDVSVRRQKESLLP